MGFLDRLFGKKKEEPTDSEHATRHCFVLCGEKQPNLQDAQQAVADVLGAGYSAEAHEDKLITVMKGGDMVGFLAHMPGPIPGEEAENNADGNVLWPTGREEAAQHKAHVIVTTSEEGSPIQSALAVTQLALVALKAYDGIGVYWGNASVCNSREFFEDNCEDISEEHLPLPIWLRFQFMQPSDGKLGVYTLGMQQFGLMDIEVDSCSMDLDELFEFVGNLAHYLIQSGPVIADGNTVGGSAEERILVRHLPSMVEGGRKVYKIIFEGE